MHSRGMPGDHGRSAPVVDDIQHITTTQDERDLLAHALKRYYEEVKALDEKSRELLNVSTLRDFEQERTQILNLLARFGVRL